MTPRDRELEWPESGEEWLTVYRIAKEEYANLSGIGAALYPGRWNAAGQEAIYCSMEIGTPVLERLVHTPKELIPKNLALMTINVLNTGRAFRHRNGATYSSRLEIFRSLGAARRDWTIERGEFQDVLGIAVPSVIVPAWNVVLFPEFFAFGHCVTLKSVEPFEFDPRLFPEAAVATG